MFITLQPTKPMYREALPSSILRSIIDRVAESIANDSAAEPMAEMRARAKDLPATKPFAAALSSEFGLIAEIKRESPSLGKMRHSDVDAIARAFAQSNSVKAVSVLTNSADFGMTIGDLGRVRRLVSQPILRKDFIFDPYQVWQARVHGADAILLMANCVTKVGLAELSGLAESLGMGVLFETHRPEDIAKLPPNPKICGINSRRFMAGKGKSTRMDYWLSRSLRWIGIRHDMSIDRSHFEMVHELPKAAIKVAESGVAPEMVEYLRDHLHFDSVLVGTSILMSERGVPHALRAFETQIRSRQLTFPINTEGQIRHAAV